MCSGRLAAQPPGCRASAQCVICAPLLTNSELLDLGHASVTPPEAQGGPGAAPSGSYGTNRWPRVTLGSAGASGTSSVASHGRRHAHIVHFAHRKKNACNGRLDSRLSGRDYDISRLKSSSIPPVRSLEAFGAQRRPLRTCRFFRNPPYQTPCAHPTKPGRPSRVTAGMRPETVHGPVTIQHTAP